MDLGVKGRVAFVGASSEGLGKAVALELAKEGAHVIINGRREELLEKSLQELEQLSGSKVVAIQGDLSNDKDRRHIIDQVNTQFDKVDILITNTGGPPSMPFEDTTSDHWDEAYELLVKSAFSFIQAFLPGMKAQQWGRIIAITSQAVKQPVENLVLSNAVRASVAGLIKTLANELGPYQITVNNVMPGFTETPRLERLIEANPSFNSATDQIPLGRFGKPREFASAVAFLASERASYITGSSLAVDGGWIKNIL